MEKNPPQRYAGRLDQPPSPWLDQHALDGHRVRLREAIGAKPDDAEVALSVGEIRSLMRVCEQAMWIELGHAAPESP